MGLRYQAKTITQLNQRLNGLDHYYRNKSLEIQKIYLTSNEDCHQVVLAVARELGVKLLVRNLT